MPTETRQQRGLALYREHASEIVEVAAGVFRVPSCSGGGFYRANPEAGTCECADRRHRSEVCKHLLAATVAAAKKRCRRARTPGPGPTPPRRHGEISGRPSRNRRGHGRPSDTPAPRDVTRDGLRGILTDPDALDRLAARLGV